MVLSGQTTSAETTRISKELDIQMQDPDELDFKIESATHPITELVRAEQFKQTASTAPDILEKKLEVSARKEDPELGHFMRVTQEVFDNSHWVRNVFRDKEPSMQLMNKGGVYVLFLVH